jgi:quercetin dioxygenase-like cupin family protein
MSQDFLPETETPVPIIRGPGEGKVVGVLRDQSTFKVLSEETGGAYAILEQKIPAGHGPPLHVHRHETEIFYVLDGRFEITIGGQKLSAAAGAIVVGPRNIPHTFSQYRIAGCPAASHRHPGTVCQLFHRSGWRGRCRCGRQGLLGLMIRVMSCIIAHEPGTSTPAFSSTTIVIRSAGR